ncbi:MAG: TonB family protein [Chthoniobacterales bacterium]
MALSCGANLRAAETPVDFRAVHNKAISTPLPWMVVHGNDLGSCVVHLVVDPVTGLVTRVYLAESSGNSYLDFKVLESLRHWKFLPGTPRLISVSFGVANWWSTYPTMERKAKPLDDILAPFLGKGTILRGELPGYPRRPAWKNKRGTGVFELHVDRSGRVPEVTLKRSSGDATFDQVTLTALREWRFRRGPIVVELPLSFVLTNTRFSVYVPKYH